MKNYFLHIICFLSFACPSLIAEAQTEFNSSSCSGTVRIFNQSGDDWTVDYYGSVVTVAAGTSLNLGLVNADHALPRSIRMASNPSCGLRLTNTNAVWYASCSVDTYSVSYYPTFYTPQSIPVPGMIVGGKQCFANSVIEIE